MPSSTLRRSASFCGPEARLVCSSGSRTSDGKRKLEGCPSSRSLGQSDGSSVGLGNSSNDRQPAAHTRGAGREERHENLRSECRRDTGPFVDHPEHPSQSWRSVMKLGLASNQRRSPTRGQPRSLPHVLVAPCGLDDAANLFRELLRGKWLLKEQKTRFEQKRG